MECYIYLAVYTTLAKDCGKHLYYYSSHNS